MQSQSCDCKNKIIMQAVLLEKKTVARLKMPSWAEMLMSDKEKKVRSQVACKYIIIKASALWTWEKKHLYKNRGKAEIFITGVSSPRG